MGTIEKAGRRATSRISDERDLFFLYQIPLVAESLEQVNSKATINYDSRFLHPLCSNVCPLIKQQSTIATHNTVRYCRLR